MIFNALILVALRGVQDKPSTAAPLGRNLPIHGLGGLIRPLIGSTAIAPTLFPAAANGSLIEREGKVPCPYRGGCGTPRRVGGADR